MDERLRRRAERQAGVFTWGDARACLQGEHDLRIALRRGEAIRVRRDAYVLAQAWQGTGPEEQLALATRAVLRTRPGDLASHQSALALHGISLWGLPVQTVQVTSAVTRSRRDPTLRIHRLREGIEHTEVEGVPCVAVAVALVQVALSESTTAAVVSLDHALKTRRCRIEQVEAAGDRLARGPLQRARLRAVIDASDAKCESVGESRTRMLLRELDLDLRSQVRISDRDGNFVGRVDFLVGDLLVIEFDGLVKYEGAEGKQALAREKAREERLTGLGCIVIRLVWADLEHPERVEARVQEALMRLAARAA